MLFHISKGFVIGTTTASLILHFIIFVVSFFYGLSSSFIIWVIFAQVVITGILLSGIIIEKRSFFIWYIILVPLTIIGCLIGGGYLMANIFGEEYKESEIAYLIKGLILFIYLSKYFNDFIYVI